MFPSSHAFRLLAVSTVLTLLHFLPRDAMAQSIDTPLDQLAQAQTTAQSYVDANGGTLIPAGRTEIDGRRVSCGYAPTILDTHLNDFGISVPGFIVLNPNLFAGLATPVKLWIFSHECAHQSVGRDEVKADCVAVRRGRREGWLTESGLAQVCEFMKPARSDSSHFSGSQRCELMQRCSRDKEGRSQRSNGDAR
jgi:hypothetical protein